MDRTNQPELLDADHIPQADLDSNLSDITRLNKLAGTHLALDNVVLKMARGVKHLVVLDACSGAGDFAIQFSDLAIRMDREVTIICGDLHSGVLHFANETYRALTLVQLDGMRLPIANLGVDIVTCSQAIHHLKPEEVTKLLAEFGRASRIGFVLLDLERSWLATLAIYGLTHLLSQNTLTRHDGPLSAQRAYRQNEIVALAAMAGLTLKTKSLHPFRWIATWQRTE
jgi:ubiquinone/menaquinone biosynthesis C-methylase UbiE